MSDAKSMDELMREAAEREGYRIEWLHSKIVMQASASAFHNLIVFETQSQFPSSQWWALPDMGVGTPGVHKGPQPDIVLVPAESLDTDENPIDYKLVAAVFEVVSHSTRAEDFMDKPEIYAGMRIPIYVIIDRKEGVVHVFSEPDGKRYLRETTSVFGKPYSLPAPVSVTIETMSYPAFGA